MGFLNEYDHFVSIAESLWGPALRSALSIHRVFAIGLIAIAFLL